MLQDCFDNTDRDMFAEGTDLVKYAESVLGYIYFCTENMLTQKDNKGVS